MDIENLITIFERKLKLQRYSANSIKNYNSTVKSFLLVVAEKFNHPDELGENEIEKYKIGSSYQRMIVASIDKFYHSVFGRSLQIKHLYPSRKKIYFIKIRNRGGSKKNTGVRNSIPCKNIL